MAAKGNCDCNTKPSINFNESFYFCGSAKKKKCCKKYKKKGKAPCKKCPKNIA